MTSTAAMRSALDRAIERGAGYLARERAPGDGLWRDYGHDDGRAASDVWASAFVAAHVGRIPEARSSAQGVVARLVANRRPSGGWGYDGALLEDCDSTAWVLLAAGASATTLPRPVLLASLRFVVEHQRTCGGFVTYGPAGVHLFGDHAQREGWFTPQPCVTAAAVAALATYAVPAFPATVAGCEYLERAAHDHTWRAYWWYGPTYATHQAVVALRGLGRLTDDRAAGVRAALLGVRNPDGGWDGERRGCSLPFTTALAVLTLLAAGARWEESRDSVALLLAHQRADGAFTPSAELLVPGGSGSEPMTLIDRGRFTTACVLHALDVVRTLSSAA